MLATLALGLAVGALAAALTASADALLAFKNGAVHAIIRRGGNSAPAVAAAAAAHAAWSAALAAAAAALVVYVAPLAGGSGVSLVLAHLNGSALPGLLSPRTLAVKWVGSVAAVAANIALGVEAPMVHLGAATAAGAADGAAKAWDGVQAVRARVRRLRSDTDTPLLPPAPPTRILHTPADRREFVSAGVAAGLAAAFGAPIGGVLFALEEASTHWSRKLAWRAFVAATVAVLTVSQAYPRVLGVLAFHGVAPLSPLDWARQLPLIAAVSIVGGILGALYQRLHRARALGALSAPPASRVAHAAFTAAAIIGAGFTLAATTGRCIDVPEWRDRGYGFALTCADGTYNDLATLLFAPQADTVRHIFSMGALTPKFDVCSGDSCYFTLRSLALLAPAYLAAMAAAGGLAVPGGLFVPAIVAGGSFGGTAGLLASTAWPGLGVQPGLYAIFGASACLGGVFRASIALVVVMVEATQNVKFVLGIAVAVLASNWVGDLVLPGGVYESDADADGRVVFLKPTPPPSLASKTAADVASRAVWCFREVEAADYVADVLARAPHGAFPIVRRGGGGGGGDANGAPAAPTFPATAASRDGVLVGLVPRSHVRAALAAAALCDDRGVPLSGCPPSSAVAAALAASGAAADAVAGDDTVHAASTAAAAAATGSSRACIDLRPLADAAPLTVRSECPAPRAHALFVGLGLRHLPVTDAGGRVVGVITRKDLDNAAGHGPWRRSRIAPPPAPPPPDGLHVPSETPGRGARNGGLTGGFARRVAGAAAVVWGGSSGGVSAASSGARLADSDA